MRFLQLLLRQMMEMETFFTIIFMFMIVVSGFDFKAMSKYDARLQEWYERTGGQVDEVIDTKLHIVEHGVGAKQDEKKPATTNGSVIDLVVPILMLIVFCMAGMVYSGGYFDTTSNCYHNFVDAFAASNASVGLVIGSLAALILTITMFVARRTLKFDNAMSCLIKGFEAMVPAVLILTLAWTLKSTRSTWSTRNTRNTRQSIIIYFSNLILKRCELDLNGLNRVFCFCPDIDLSNLRFIVISNY